MISHHFMSPFSKPPAPTTRSLSGGGTNTFRHFGAQLESGHSRRLRRRRKGTKPSSGIGGTTTSVGWLAMAGANCACSDGVFQMFRTIWNLDEFGVLSCGWILLSLFLHWLWRKCESTCRPHICGCSHDWKLQRAKLLKHWIGCGMAVWRVLSWGLHLLTQAAYEQSFWRWNSGQMSWRKTRWLVAPSYLKSPRIVFRKLVWTNSLASPVCPIHCLAEIMPRRGLRSRCSCLALQGSKVKCRSRAIHECLVYARLRCFWCQKMPKTHIHGRSGYEM